MDRLQIQQNKVMRIVLNCNKRTHIGTMLDLLNWLPVHRLVQKANLTLIYKIDHGLMPSYLGNFLKKREIFVNYSIRSRLNYNIQPVKLSSLQKTLFFEGVRLFNSLPDTVKHAPSFKVFDRAVFRYLKTL